MYLERRKNGKYYLVHSYRNKGKVKKIRKYLGLNLNSEELQRRKEETEKIILEIIEEFNTEVFKFSLTDKKIEILNKYDSLLKINHLENFDWIKLCGQGFVL